MRRLVGIDLRHESVPDETTVCKFRHLLERTAWASRSSSASTSRRVCLRGDALSPAFSGRQSRHPRSEFGRCRPTLGGHP
jgi:hypothetical protein